MSLVEEILASGGDGRLRDVSFTSLLMLLMKVCVRQDQPVISTESYIVICLLILLCSFMVWITLRA